MERRYIKPNPLLGPCGESFCFKTACTVEQRPGELPKAVCCDHVQDQNALKMWKIGSWTAPHMLEAR